MIDASVYTSRLAKTEREETAEVELAADLVKLETHFQKPPKVHNDDRRRRQELSVIRSDIANPEKRCKVLQGVKVEGASLVLERVTELAHGWKKIRVQKATADLQGGCDGGEVYGMDRLSLGGMQGVKGWME